MCIIPATDLDSVRDLLESAGLPHDDVGLEPAACFYLMQAAAESVAVIGIECHGRSALLRSLVVRPEYRGRGLAARLVEHIQQIAAAQGIEALYLLTTSAADYFRRLGFSDLARDLAPAAIRQTAEFAHLCPDSARLLYRRV